MPEVRTFARPVAAPRITPSQRLLRQILEQAMNETIISVDSFIREESRSPVPVYEPALYRYPRRKGKTKQLLLSGRVSQTATGFGLEISWNTPYAQHLIEGGLSGRLHRRKPGTSLKWVGIVRRTTILIYLSKLRSLALRHGVEMSRFNRLTGA